MSMQLYKVLYILRNECLQSWSSHLVFLIPLMHGLDILALHQRLVRIYYSETYMPDHLQIEQTSLYFDFTKKVK